MAAQYPTYTVMLLDGRQYSCRLSSKSCTEELFDSVISYLGIQEKEYFGLCYINEPGKYREWVSLEKRLCEQDFPKRHHESILHFAVKYYIDSICWLHDPTTVEQFYLQAREAIYTEKLECNCDLMFKLAALGLQEILGDYGHVDDAAIKILKKSNLISQTVFNKFTSPQLVFSEVIRHYKSLQGWSRGKAIINYLNKATELRGYGVHYYQVKDKNGIPWWVGMSPRGIAQYSLQNTYTPELMFKWNELDNVYFRDKKFSIEVNHGSDGMSAIQQKHYSSVLMYAWYSSHSKLIKSMWQMAVHQHQFYLEKKVNASSRMRVPGARSLNDIVAELSTSMISLDIIEQENKNGVMFDSKSEESILCPDTPSSGSAKQDLLSALQEQRQFLLEKREELQNTLATLEKEENDIRGNVEANHVTMPTLYQLHPDVLQNTPTDVVSRLELEYEIQKKIIHAAVRLAKEKGMNKNVKKERHAAVQRAQVKMLDIERRLESARRFRKGGNYGGSCGGGLQTRERSYSGHRSLPDSLNERTSESDEQSTRGEQYPTYSMSPGSSRPGSRCSPLPPRSRASPQPAPRTSPHAPLSRNSPLPPSHTSPFMYNKREHGIRMESHSSHGSLTSRLEEFPATGFYGGPDMYSDHDYNLRVLKANKASAKRRLQGKHDPATDFALEMKYRLANNTGQSTLV